jgi:hypothetical protein
MTSIEAKAQGYHAKGATSPRSVVLEFMNVAGAPDASKGLKTEDADRCAS